MIIDGGDLNRTFIYSGSIHVFCSAGLQNDRKQLLKEIEEGLEAVHANSRDSSEASSASASGRRSSETKLPFAYIKSVEPDSPASRAGLQVNDELLEVGSVNEKNFTSLLDIKAVIESSEDKRVRVLLQRKGPDGNVKLVLTGLTPKRWSGEGLVGCTVFPLEKRS